jgi:hypothetical protein
MELHPLTRDIAAHKANIAAVLVGDAFRDVVNDDQEVAGNRGGMRLAILHLPISGRTFYEQVIAVGDDFDATRALVNGIVSEISG